MPLDPYFTASFKPNHLTQAQADEVARLQALPFKESYAEYQRLRSLRYDEGKEITPAQYHFIREITNKLLCKQRSKARRVRHAVEKLNIVAGNTGTGRSMGGNHHARRI